MHLDLTDFQKDCLVKAKDHLNKIPRQENNIVRWNLMPGKVAVIVDFWKQSKLSAEAFADSLMITKSLLPKFARGRTPSNEKWPELLALLKPEEAEKNKVKKEKQKSEKVVEDAIFKVLLREQIREIGLRTETIATEISSYPSRFVSTCLGRLERAGRLVKFKGEDRYTKWKVVSKDKLPVVPVTSIDSIIPKVKIVEEPKIQKIELPELGIGDIDRKKDFYQDLKIGDLELLTEGYVTVKIPISKVPQFSFPLETWVRVLYRAYSTSPSLTPDFEDYWQCSTNLNMIKCLEKAKTRMKLNSYQEVIDRFSLILDSVGLY